jgi:hypothetical protein
MTGRDASSRPLPAAASRSTELHNFRESVGPAFGPKWVGAPFRPFTSARTLFQGET